MDWSSIAGVVGAVAPTLGALLGSAFGPLGGVVGSIAGKAIAGALGVEATPEAVSAALAKDKNAVEKLRILEATKATEIVEEARVEVERLKANVAQSSEINQSIRAEAGKVSWWHWRNLIGYGTLFWGMLPAPFVVAGMIVLVKSGKADTLNAVIAAMGTLMGWIGILAALNGYIASDTTNRYNTAVTGEHSAGGIMNTVRSVFGAKK